MASIEKLPSGNYRARVYNPRTKKYKSLTAPTKRELNMLISQYLTTEDDTVDMTIGGCMDRYLDNRKNVLSPSTLRGYHQLRRNYYGDIEYLSAKSITSEQIQAFVNEISLTHSPKTTRNIYGFLVTAIKAFYPSKHISPTLPQKKSIERHIHTNKDVKQLVDLSDGDLKKGILLASVGTMRRGEICALKYGDITGNTIHVHADMVQNDNNEWVYKEIPKTSASDRYITFPQKVIDELGQGDPDKYVVTINPNSLTQAYTRLRDRIGIKCRFHDLRHYAASIAHAIGIGDSYIMQRGGWGSDAILKSVYRNVLDDQRIINEDKINGYMDNLLND